jgi:hypothetical protein
MASAWPQRRVAILLLALWVISSGALALHTHDDCRGSRHDGDDDPASCSICEAVHHVPLTVFAHPETLEAKRDVIVWISPWIAIVPEEVFFDRPLARGPPSPV